MAKYFINDTTLIGIADKTRALSGTTKTMTPLEIKAELGILDTDMESQESIIEQIVTMVDSRMVVFITFRLAYGGVIVETAKAGMTWDEWCNSEYNTLGFRSYGYDNRVSSSSGAYMVIDTFGNYVKLSDEIIADANYLTVGGGSED